MMKKIVLITTIVLTALVIAVACKKDEGQDALQFKFGVTSKTETIETGIGTNDVIPLEFFIERQYVTGSEMTYNITSNRKNFTITNSKGEELTQNKSYKISSDTLVINYKGLEQGTHTIQVLFKNDKGTSVEKRISLTFANYDFNYSVTTEKKEIYQGEEVTYKLNIDSSDLNAGDYSIKFTSYEENDKNLDKSSVLFEGEKIEFDKWYKLKSLSDTKIDINSFYSGAKILKGVIKNKNSERYFELNQTIKNRVVTIGSSDVSKTMITSIGEKILYKAIIEKKPKQNNKIWYKTWTTINSKAPEDGITTTKNDFVESTLTDTGYFEIPIETKKGGEYQYNIIFKDEFGNESTMDSKNITVDNKDFSIHLRQDYKPNEVYQGQELVHLVRVEQLQNVTKENYQIRFLSFEDQDPSLSKSKILYRQNDVNINEEVFVINQWKALNANDMEKGFFVVLNSFYTGTKKIKFEVKNSQETKTYEFEISVKQIQYQIKLETDAFEIELGKTANIKMFVSSNVEIPNNTLEYKVEEQEYKWEYYRYVWKTEKEILNWTKVGITNSTTFSYRRDRLYIQDRRNIEGNQSFKKYKLKVDVKDKYGNTAEKEIEIRVKGIIVNKIEVSDIKMRKSVQRSWNNVDVYFIELYSFTASANIIGSNGSRSQITHLDFTIGNEVPYGGITLLPKDNNTNFNRRLLTPENAIKRDYNDFKKKYPTKFVPVKISMTDAGGCSIILTESVKVDVINE